jgi:uncharacterized membrane protein YphA (DoxX/SURF4 family)
MSVSAQRDVSISQLTATRASGAVVLIRLYVGLIFAGEGVLKFLRPDTLGPGRFEKVGIAAPAVMAYLDGVFEIGCGIAILAGLLTRLATLPMIVDMVGALTITKVPLLWGDAPLYPSEGGVWDFFHEGRLEVAMLCGSIFLLIVGAGRFSLDSRLHRPAAPTEMIRRAA